MKLKLFKKVIDSILSIYELPCHIEENRKEETLSYSLFPNLIFFHKIKAFTIQIQKNFFILDILGWKIMEKIETEEFSAYQEVYQLEVFQIIEDFFQRKIKIKLFLTRGKPYLWEIYRLNQDGWNLFHKYRKSFSFHKKHFMELDFDSLKNK
ncbi:MAG TPA: hypothetical protein DHW82_12680 [Spirochaetia bacterium]|nr:MAG: hypothetical protein A2Y41_06150 [Spirochaetes bacterium GWB1_36_13]HCL57845.1 hypothetical protein [Spirochaetia bacterium]